MAFGTEFQRVGAGMEKALCPQVLFLVRMEGGQGVSVSRAEGAGGSVSVEELGQVGWGQVMEGFEGHEKEFKMDSLGDGEPVELMDSEGDVVMGPRVGERASSKVLDVLEFIEDFQ